MTRDRLSRWTGGLVVACAVGMLVTPAPGATIHVPGDYTAIQPALDAAVSGDTVLVADGTYTGFLNRELDFHGRDIILMSENGYQNCIIDAQGVTRVFAFNESETNDAVVEGFTVRNGWRPSGAGGAAFLIDDGSSPTIRDCYITTCTTTWGGAVFVRNGSPVFERCTFFDNTGFTGGAMFITTATCTIRDCVFEQNQAESGGAVSMYQFGTNVWMEGCRFLSNTADPGTSQENYGGGAITAVALVTYTVLDCEFVGNRCIDSLGGAIGNVTGSLASIINSKFHDNEADWWGGAVANDASGCGLVNVLFTGNTAPRGGAVSNGAQGDLTARNVTLCHNTATLAGGGIASRGAGEDTWMWNMIVYGNTAPQHAQVWNEDGVGVLLKYSLVQGGWSGAGNMDADPEFRGFGDGGVFDYRPTPGSPMIDSGTNESVSVDLADLDGDGDFSEPIPFDLDGMDRIVANPCVPASPVVVDMGAYEFGGPCGGCDADVTDDGVVSFPDLLAVLSNWGPCVGCPEDVDGDDEVAFNDLLMVLSSWGPCP